MTTPSSSSRLVLLREERDLLQELLERRLLAVALAGPRRVERAAARRVVLAGDADQLLEVLEPALGLDRPLLLERVEVADLVQGVVEQVADLGAVGAVAQLLHRLHEATDRLDRRRAESRNVLRRARDVEDRLADRVGVRDDPTLRGLADPAPRRVDDALERDDVVRVGQERQVGERVLDLRALVEARPADHLVADAVADQRVLEHAALGIGPVEDGDVVARPAALDVALDLAGDVARLGVLVLELADADGVAALLVGPEVLAHPLAVVRDDRVGGVEDRLRRAVVLLELDHRRVGEVVLEVEDVADVGMPEGIDRLIVVADDREVAVLLGQQPQPDVLGVVGVLVLVDEHEAERAAVALEHLGKHLEEPDRLQQQVVEVHRVHRVDPLLVELVDLGDRLLEVPADLQLVGGGVEQLALGVGDLALDRPRRVALRDRRRAPRRTA